MKSEMTKKDKFDMAKYAIKIEHIYENGICFGIDTDCGNFYINSGKNILFIVLPDCDIELSWNRIDDKNCLKIKGMKNE